MSATDATICVTCLSRNRKLFSVKKIKQWLNVFCHEIQTQLHLSDENNICWECKSKIINMALFITQASKAQKLLEGIYMGKTHASLSKLSVFSLPPVSFDESLEEGRSLFYENSFPMSTDNLDETVTIKQENIFDDSLPPVSFDESLEEGRSIFYENSFPMSKDNLDDTVTIKQENIFDDSTVSVETHSDVKAETVSNDHNYCSSVSETLKFELNTENIKQDITESTDSNIESEYNGFTHKIKEEIPNTSNSILETCLKKNCNDESQAIQANQNVKSYEVPILVPVANTVNIRLLDMNSYKYVMLAGKPVIMQFSHPAQVTAPSVSLQNKDEKCNVEEQKDDATEKMYKMKTLTDEEVEQERREQMKKIANVRYKCELCVLSFNSKLFLKDHMRRHENSFPYICKICKQKFILKKYLDLHAREHYIRYECYLCKYTKDEYDSVIKHYEKMHSGKVKVCPDCGATFTAEGKYRYHRKTHTQATTCNECGKKCPNTWALRKHKLIHGPYQMCPQCGKAVKDLEGHLRNHKPKPKLEPVYCAECNMTFQSSYRYKNHLKVSVRHRQPGDCKFACTQCDKKFFYKALLRFHTVAVHTKNYQYQCDYCGKGYVRKDTLKWHIFEKHQGMSRPKNKMCKVCGKAFKYAMTLKIHMRTHTGEKPYHCDLCPWRFAQHSTLVTHMRGKHPEVSGGFTEKDKALKRRRKIVEKQNKVRKNQRKLVKQQDKIVEKQDKIVEK